MLGDGQFLTDVIIRYITVFWIFMIQTGLSVSEKQILDDLNKSKLSFVMCIEFSFYHEVMKLKWNTILLRL